MKVRGMIFTHTVLRKSKSTAMAQMAQLLELLPHSARDPGSIPTSGVVCVEFACSPCDRLGAPVSSHIPKTGSFVD